MDKHYSPQKMSKFLGVTVRTLQNWDRSGKLKALHTPTERRYYTHRQYMDYMGASSSEEITGTVLIYTRVSNRGQMDDLKNQEMFLRTFANAKGWIVDEVVQDIGSGLNYNRKKWNQVLTEVQHGKVSKIIVAHKDRFIRSGYEWFDRFLQSHGVEMVVVNNEQLSSEHELVQGFKFHYSRLFLPYLWFKEVQEEDTRG